MIDRRRGQFLIAMMLPQELEPWYLCDRASKGKRGGWTWSRNPEAARKRSLEWAETLIAQSFAPRHSSNIRFAPVMLADACELFQIQFPGKNPGRRTRRYTEAAITCGSSQPQVDGPGQPMKHRRPHVRPNREPLASSWNRTARKVAKFLLPGTRREPPRIVGS